MNKHTKIAICVLAVFIVGMTLSVAFAEPEVKCKYKKGYKQYLGSKKKYGKTYSVYVCYEKKNGMQNGKKGWWTSGSNDGLSDWAKIDTRYNKHHPVTKLKLH